MKKELPKDKHLEELIFQKGQLEEGCKRIISKSLDMGLNSCLGQEAEKKLAAHIAKLQACGFAPTPFTIGTIAYDMAKELGLANKFSDEKGRAGRSWFAYFSERNPTLHVGKDEGISLMRAIGMNREGVSKYFDLLQKMMTDANLLNKSAAMYNMDEINLQWNNRLEKLVTKKGSTMSSVEKWKEVTVISCCNAKGNFLPPFCIFKGENKKSECHLRQTCECLLSRHVLMLKFLKTDCKIISYLGNLLAK